MCVADGRIVVPAVNLVLLRWALARPVASLCSDCRAETAYTPVIESFLRTTKTAALYLYLRVIFARTNYLSGPRSCYQWYSLETTHRARYLRWAYPEVWRSSSIDPPRHYLKLGQISVINSLAFWIIFMISSAIPKFQNEGDIKIKQKAKTFKSIVLGT